MMIIFHKNFDKKYRKLDKKMQEKVDIAISKFIKNPFTKSLKNHRLQGRLQGKCAFCVTGDVRIIFEQHNNYYLVIMLDVDTHNQVY